MKELNRRKYHGGFATASRRSGCIRSARATVVCSTGERQGLAGHGPMHASARDVVPVRPGLVVAQKEEAVVQAFGSEVEQASVHHGDQTGPAVAGRSEGHKIGLAAQFALGHVMVGHLPNEKGQMLPGPFYDQEVSVFWDRTVGENASQGNTAADAQPLEELTLLQAGAPDVELLQGTGHLSLPGPPLDPGYSGERHLRR